MSSDQTLILGVYSSEESLGLYKASFNQETGAIGNKSLLVELKNPSYLDISDDGKWIYSVNELGDGGVSALKWNKDMSGLEIIDSYSSKGAHPCYVALNNKENLLATANYSSGNVLVYDIEEGGALGDQPQIKTHVGSGTVKPNQESAHAHCSVFSEDDRFLYVADLGIDEVAMYTVDGKGRLGEKQVALSTDKGDGPRHITFHPTKDYVFIVNELSGSVISAHVDKISGRFHRMDKKSTLPADFKAWNACADIHVSPDGKFLYASNRGHNSLAIFKIMDSGMLEPIGHESVRGETPRNFNISPNGKFVLVGNQNTNNITVFARDAATGLLTNTGNELKLGKPVCIKFMP